MGSRAGENVLMIPWISVRDAAAREQRHEYSQAKTQTKTETKGQNQGA